MPSTPSSVRMATPTDIQSFQAWILSSPPYTNNSRFPDVNDFTTAELEAILHFTIAKYHQAKVNLASALDASKLKQINDVLIRAVDTLQTLSSFPLPSPSTFSEIVFTAKFADDLRFQNLVVGLKGFQKRLRKEKERIIRVSYEIAGGSGVGDEDDWFLVESNEQQKLYEAIEEHLRSVGVEGRV